MSEPNFSWVQTHKELVDILKRNRTQQQGLIDVLRKAGIAGLHDEPIKGQREDLKEIDPFSFFCYIYKHGESKRLEKLQDIADQFNLTKPTDTKGIPSVNAQKVCMFPFKHHRVENEIERLWDFFESALNDSITDEQFQDVLSIRGVGKTKLTEGLFSILPEKYFPINGPTKPYLRQELGIDPKFESYSEYIAIIKNK